MTEIELLSQMIKDTAKIDLFFMSNPVKASVVLTEPESNESSVTIHGLPKNAIVIKVDKFASPDTIFAGSKNECKRADFVIVSDDDSKKRILYIEMKSTKAPMHEIVDQMKGAICFIGYCKEIAKIFWNETNFDFFIKL